MSSRLCRYGCGQELTWDTATSSFKEQSGVPHTKERCASLKAPKPKTEDTEKAVANGGDYSKMHEENMVANRLLVAAINRLASAIDAKRA